MPAALSSHIRVKHVIQIANAIQPVKLANTKNIIIDAITKPSVYANLFWIAPTYSGVWWLISGLVITANKLLPGPTLTKTRELL